MGTSQPVVVGRTDELGCIRSFLGGSQALPALVLTGAPGIGKTTVWEAAVESAETEGWRVLRARAAESEAQLSFVAVNDLLDDVDVWALRGLPEPQRHALEVVRFRIAREDQAPDPSAALLAFANVLRVIAAEQRLLISIDDVQWLDRPSAEALAYAARRLRDVPVRFLLARRSGPRSSIERAFEPRPLQRLELHGLSLGAIRVLLSERLDLRIPRRLMRQLFDAAEGNPLLALELARAVKACPARLDVVGLEAVADVSMEPFAAGVAALSTSVRRALLAVVLSPDLSRDELESMCGLTAVEDALSRELLVDRGGRIGLAHPLLAPAVSRRVTVAERRLVHREIARTLVDQSRAIPHAALATIGYDPELAARAASAAAAALACGAVYDAVELGQHALRLTDVSSPHHAERVLRLARYLLIAGELPAVSELLERWVEKLPAGRPRALAHLLLGEVSPLDEHERHLDLVLEQSEHEPDLRADALSAKSILLALIRVAQIPRAQELAEQARAVSGAGQDAMQRAMHALAWTRALGGRAIDGVARADAGPSMSGSLYESAGARPAAVRLVWRGEVSEARTALRRLLALSEERGEARSCVVLQLHLCELELRVGDVRAAEKMLDDWDAWTAGEAATDIKTIRARCEALLAAVRGRTAEAADWAARAVALSEESQFTWDRLEALRAQALAALHDHAPQRALGPLREVWEHTRDEGVVDPGAFPVAPDLVEVLYRVGAAGEAEGVLDVLARAAREQRHPWAGAALTRCQAETSLAHGRDEEALERFEAAAAAYRQLDLRFDSARAMLSAGAVARSLRRWGTARRLLGDAEARLAELGCGGWAEEARVQLERIAARKPAPAGQLTAAEQRVATLAAAGLSNKEIATRLVISASTVETHLKRCYAKLRVGSRSQLSTALTAVEDPGPS